MKCRWISCSIGTSGEDVMRTCAQPPIIAREEALALGAVVERGHVWLLTSNPAFEPIEAPEGTELRGKLVQIVRSFQRARRARAA